MRVVVVGRRMGRTARRLHHKIGLRHDDHIASALRVIAAPHQREHAVARRLCRENLLARESRRDHRARHQGRLHDPTRVFGADRPRRQRARPQMIREVVARKPRLALRQRAKRGVEGLLHRRIEFRHFDPTAPSGLGPLGQRRHAMVGSEHDHAPGEPHVAVDPVEDCRQHPVEPQHRVHHLVAVGPVTVPDRVDLRKTHAEQIGACMPPELLLDHRPLHKLAQRFRAERRVIIGREKIRRHRRRAAVHRFGKHPREPEVHRLARRIVRPLHPFIHLGRQQALPRFAKHRLRPLLRVEGRHPRRQRRAVVA